MSLAKTQRTDVRRWARAGYRISWIRDKERAVLSTEKASCVEGLQRIALCADLQVLANIDESGHVRILRPKSSGNERTQMRHGHRLRRLIARMPMELVSRMQNENKVSHAVASDQRPAIHDAGKPFPPLRQVYAINRCRAAGNCAEHALRLEPALVGGVGLPVEFFVLRHAAGHPEEEQRVSARLDFLSSFRQEQPRGTARKRGQ